MKRTFNFLLLNRLMTERGMNMSMLAKKLGVSPSDVSRWLKGAIPHDDKIELLNKFFGTDSIDWFNINFSLYLYPIPKIEISNNPSIHAYSINEMDEVYLRKHYTEIIIDALKEIERLLRQGLPLQEAINEANRGIEEAIKGIGLGKIELSKTRIDNLWE